MMANHGQSRQYYHDTIGVNSRLDSLQAGILDIKLQHLDSFNTARQALANKYDVAFANNSKIKIPTRASNVNHVFHQYTILYFDKND